MSTAKSMAANYLSAKRSSNQQDNVAGRSSQPRSFKSSTSNLSTAAAGSTNRSRIKSTSMTNLSAGNQTAHMSHNPGGASRGLTIQRPASRNALDSIHCGMNAKYAQVQSKVLLQNIRPQNSAQSPTTNPTRSAAGSGKLAATANKSATGRFASNRTGAGGTLKMSQQNIDKQALLNRVKALQEELDKQERLNDSLRNELERERLDKQEQVQQLKMELQEKINEHERQNEDYHQKLLEAYELADQNRRAAETVLHESRQRDEESRSKIEELENQLEGLKEFVSMKEEMSGKMFELREQLREERERYEDQLRNLHQVFENEKLSKHYVKRSKYFSRMKPSLLQSSECVSSGAATTNNNVEQHPCISSSTIGIDQINGDAKKRHRSEHDLMYGSKLSTRMQDGARSAWRASKQFASSVITGGKVSLSACRHRKNRQRHSVTTTSASSSSSNTLPAKHKQQAQVSIQQQQMCSPQDEHMTSVIQVPYVNGEANNISMSHGDGDKSVIQTGANIKLDDQTNKLTIVTRFTSDANSNSSDTGIGSNTSTSTSSASSGAPAATGAGPGAPQLTPVDKNSKLIINSSGDDSNGVGSCGSERSRCESSSSGRGTFSDTDSSSHNGDLVVAATAAPGDANKNTNNNNNSEQIINSGNGIRPQTRIYKSNDNEHKRHKRKSSLFKASKVFSGSQASLNKLRTFFTGHSSSPTPGATVALNEYQNTKRPVHQQPSYQDDETTHETRHYPHPEEAISAAEREIKLATIGGVNDRLSGEQPQQQIEAEVIRCQDNHRVNGIGNSSATTTDKVEAQRQQQMHPDAPVAVELKANA